jgi:hypothetical protein
MEVDGWTEVRQYYQKRADSSTGRDKYTAALLGRLANSATSQEHLRTFQEDIQRTKLTEEIGWDAIKSMEQRQRLRALGYDKDTINGMINEMERMKLQKAQATRGKQNFRGRGRRLNRTSSQIYFSN